MISAYLAISYKCNQHCSFCPCSKEETKFPFLPIEELKKTANSFKVENKIETLVVSGGEPTIHPNIKEFIRFLTKELDINLVILSNGEKYSNMDFCKDLFDGIDMSKITTITTIHSQTASEHERINGSKGSHERSLNGLRNMVSLGADVIIKHCITNENYKELDLFYKYITETMPIEATIQLCSIDYCGVNKESLKQQKLSFVELRPYLEKMFDCYIEDREAGSKRYMYAINMPFCACDPYYWNILTRKSDTYSDYASPSQNGNAKRLENIENNVGTFANACKNCAAEEICPGTYKTAFELFGDEIIKAFKEE